MSEAAPAESIEAFLPRAPGPLATARIDEGACIGCTLCVAACPVDAIVGAAKLMHTVLAEHCIGCELCLPPCPVDCIAMLAAGRSWSKGDTESARERFSRRNARIDAGQTRGNKRGATAIADSRPDAARMRRQAAVAAALARARARRAAKRCSTK